jgi:exosome complex component CSL4
MNKQKIVFPGEEITTEEEYSAGRNTYTEKGKIKSKLIGIAEFDENKKEAKIKGKSIREIRQGDVVIGEAMLVKESSAVIELLTAENNKKITGIKTAQLPIRNVSTEYVSELRQKIKIGDIVRAKVTQATPLVIDLATNETGLGVIKAYCSNCRKEMNYSNGKMMCLNCGNVEERKWYEQEQKPREYAPRENGYRERGFGGHRRENGFNRGYGTRRERGFGGKNQEFGNREREFNRERTNREKRTFGRKQFNREKRF